MKNTKIVKLLASTLLAFNCTSCAKNNNIENEPNSQNNNPTAYSNISLDCGFDTFFSLKEYAPSKDVFNKHFEEATQTFSYCNKLFDIYNNYEGINNLKTINDQAGVEPVKVDPLIIELLQEAKEFYDLSDGEFDITSGNLLHLWHTYRDQGIDANQNNEYYPLPSVDELTSAASHRGFDAIEINTQDSTVYIKDKNVQLDVGGIAKGFAAEYTAKILETLGVNDGTNINAGGNIRTIGSKPDNSPWRIGIQDPRHEGSLLAVAIPGSISSVTSGDYERYYIAEDGNRYHHIIDPSTMYPATYYHSVTVFTKDSSVADCLSTALFTMNLEDGQHLLKTYSEKHPETPCYAIWIMDQDKKQGTEGKTIQDYFVAYSEQLSNSITWR